MIDKAIEPVSPREEPIFVRLRSGTKGAKVMDECPAPDTIFSGHQMAMKVATSKEISIDKPHVAINHIAGTMSSWESIGKGKRSRFPAEFEDGITSRTIGQVFLCPKKQVGNVLLKL